MSHIVKNKEDLMLIKDLFELLRKGNVSVDVMEEVVKNLLPKSDEGELLVEYHIYDRGYFPASFSLSDNSISLSIDEMNRWVDTNICKFLNNYQNIEVTDILKDYILLFIIIHEIEHSYQYLMAYDVVDAPCELVSGGYKLLIDTIVLDELSYLGIKKKIKNSISQFLYNRHKGKYVMERNANVEACDLLERLSFLCGYEEISRLFHETMCEQLAYGYHHNNRGSFEETFDKILMLDEYKKIECNCNMSEFERIRYGLPMSEKTRIKLLVSKQ